MYWNLSCGYVCIVLNKETNLYKITTSDDVTKEFKDLELGDSNKVIHSYWIYKYRTFTKYCYQKFKNKNLKFISYMKKLYI